MKNLVTKLLVLFLSLCFWTCKYDDADIWKELERQKDAIEKLQTLCTQMNLNLSSLQSIVNALQENDYVTSVEPILNEDGIEIGYTITFTQSEAITIYHGTSGEDGKTPYIGVKQDDDGVYYWTIDGAWMLDENGNKIQAKATSPKVKVDNDYWYVSYDGGATWEQLDKAIAGTQELSIKSLIEDDSYVYITLYDGTELKLLKKIEDAELISLSFKAEHNQLVLIEDLYVNIQDSVGECFIPHMVPNKMLIPVYEFRGSKVEVNGSPVVSGETKLDFSKPVTFDVINNHNDTISYVVNVRAYTGLPIMTIKTDYGWGVDSKETYRNANITIVEDITSRGSGDVFESRVRIKGRGNTTWNMPKKPYKLKFDEKVSLFGQPKDKEWVLLANYLDNSLMRNEVAMWLGKQSNLPWTSSTHYVELILNGEYLGTYMVAEQIKISKDRVNVTDDGYLLEIDSKASADDITFRINTIPQPINIKDPEVEVESEKYNYIVDYMTQVETVLFSENWLDPIEGWQKYMDLDSFVDWYLINEIARNNDAVFFTSCFMHLAPGGKLFMGPIWDFDLAFGNYENNSLPTGWYIKGNTTWYDRLFEDPVFKARVKERYKYFYSIKDNIINEINTSARYLERTAIENNNKWSVLYKAHAYDNVILGTYYNEVNFLKQWLSERMDWLSWAYTQI